MITVVAIDDEPLALEVIKSFCSDSQKINLLKCFTDPTLACEYINSTRVDLVFLDIFMPEMDGFNVINNISSDIKVILTTAFRNYAIKSYEYDIIDYLVKPISYKRFIKSIEKYMDRKSQNIINEKIIINLGVENLVIDSSNILYFKGSGDYSEIILKDRRILTSEKLKNLENLNQSFIRIHKSYIININNILKIRKTELVMANNEIIPFGRKYRNTSIIYIIKTFH